MNSNSVSHLIGRRVLIHMRDGTPYVGRLVSVVGRRMTLHERGIEPLSLDLSYAESVSPVTA